MEKDFNECKSNEKCKKETNKEWMKDNEDKAKTFLAELKEEK